MRPPLAEADIDQITAQVFATPDGRAWLALHEHSHPEMVSTIRARIRRQRLVWGDKTPESP